MIKSIRPITSITKYLFTKITIVPSKGSSEYAAICILKDENNNLCEYTNFNIGEGLLETSKYTKEGKAFLIDINSIPNEYKSIYGLILIYTPQKPFYKRIRRPEVFLHKNFSLEDVIYENGKPKLYSEFPVFCPKDWNSTQKKWASLKNESEEEITQREFKYFCRPYDFKEEGKNTQL